MGMSLNFLGFFLTGDTCSSTTRVEGGGAKLRRFRRGTGGGGGAIGNFWGFVVSSATLGKGLFSAVSSSIGESLSFAIGTAGAWRGRLLTLAGGNVCICRRGGCRVGRSRG